MRASALQTVATGAPVSEWSPSVASFELMPSEFLATTVPFGFAHQGGTDIAPGNTEAAFQHAVSLGYSHIETDVQATADGILAVFHDDDLGPLTGTKGKIADRSWAELSELQVGGEHPIPRFEDMVERFPTVRFNVDPKNDLAVNPLVELIHRHGLEERVCVGSFSGRRLAQFRSQVGPPVCTSPAIWGVVRVLAAAVLGRKGTSSPNSALQIPTAYYGIPLTGKWLMGRVHRLGLQIHVWTINEEAEMNRLLDNGVDAIMTDRVTLLRDVLQTRGHWPPSG